MVGGGLVDADGDPGHDAVLDAVAEIGIVWEGVVVVVGALLGDAVVLVVGACLGVGVVRRHGVDCVDQVFVEEELADVDDIVGFEGLVGEDGTVQVGHQMDVGGSSGVVSWEEDVEETNTLVVDLCDTTLEGLVEVGSVGLVAITRSYYTSVDTSSIGGPGLEVKAGGNLAGLDIDVLVFNMDWDTLLILDDVGAVVLTSDIVWTVGDLRCKDARGVLVAGEEC